MHCDGLTIDCYTNAGGMSVRLRGELDAHNGPEAAGTLAGLIDHSTGDVEVDVNGVEFVDSAGIRLLVELSRGMDVVHRRLSLVYPSPVFARIIELLESDTAAADRPSCPGARRESVTLAAGGSASLPPRGSPSAHAGRSVTTRRLRAPAHPAALSHPAANPHGTLFSSVDRSGSTAPSDDLSHLTEFGRAGCRSGSEP